MPLHEQPRVSVERPLPSLASSSRPGSPDRRIAFHECEILSLATAAATATGQGGQAEPKLELQVQLRGGSIARTAAREWRMDGGDFLIHDPAERTSISPEPAAEILILRLSGAAVDRRLPLLRQSIGRQMHGQAGTGALFVNFVRTAWTQYGEGGRCIDTVGDLIWLLLDLAYSSERFDHPESSSRDVRRRALLRWVADNLCDPNLNAHRMARVAGVSTRYVQMLFADLATTPTAYIRGQRLELARSRLRQEGKRCSITEVAFDVGFNDLSSFCRAFRSRFHVTPSAFRAGSGTCAPPPRRAPAAPSSVAGS